MTTPPPPPRPPRTGPPQPRNWPTEPPHLPPRPPRRRGGLRRLTVAGITIGAIGAIFAIMVIAGRAFDTTTTTRPAATTTRPATTTTRPAATTTGLSTNYIDTHPVEYLDGYETGRSKGRTAGWLNGRADRLETSTRPDTSSTEYKLGHVSGQEKYTMSTKLFSFSDELTCPVGINFLFGPPDPPSWATTLHHRAGFARGLADAYYQLESPGSQCAPPRDSDRTHPAETAGYVAGWQETYQPAYDRGRSGETY